MDLRICISNKFPVTLMLLAWRLHFIDACSKPQAISYLMSGILVEPLISCKSYSSEQKSSIGFVIIVTLRLKSPLSHSGAPGLES